MRKGTTINGKTLSVIEKELRKPIPDNEMSSRTDNGKLYISVEAYEKRLDDVIGVLNYDRISQGGKIVEVAGKMAATAMTIISIYDDDGNVCLRKASPGAADIIIVNKTGEAKSIKSDIASATAESFKNCCKLLKIGVDQLRQDKKEKSNGKNNSNTRNAEKHISEPDPVKLHRVKFLTRLSKGNKHYNADVVDTETGEKLKFKLFEKEVPLIEEHMALPKFIEIYVKDKELSFFGHINEFYGERQIVFCRPSVSTRN